jgi:tetratricopeptide (TPR) repeat protein
MINKEHCVSTSRMPGLEPPPAAIACDVEAIRDQLSRALTLEREGHTEESLVIAREARRAAERLKYRPVYAEALAQMARALDGRQAADARREAQGLYFEALDIAEAERHDQLAAMIWTRLVLLALQMDSGTQRAHAWWRRSAAAVGRLGNSACEQAMLHHMLGEIYYRDGKYAEAEREENEAINTLDMSSDTPEHQLELTRYYDALAKSLERQGRVDESIGLHERAVRTARGVLGAAHPDVIKLRMNYGLALKKQGKFGRARSELEAALASMPPEHRISYLDAGLIHGYLSELSYEQGELDDAVAHAHESLQIFENAGAPDHRRAEVHTNIANAELKCKNFARALAMYQDALALRRPHLGRDHYQVGVNEGSIAEALVGLARYDDALVHVREAERIFAHGSARNREIRAWILTVRGEILLGQQQLSAAVPVLEQALPLFDGAPDPSNHAYAVWALARALHGLDSEPDRVRQLAEKALALFTKLGAPEVRNRDAVRQFLHRLPPAPAGSLDPTSGPFDLPIRS